MTKRSVDIPDDLLADLSEIAENDPHFDNVSQVIRYGCRVARDDKKEYGEAT